MPKNAKGAKFILGFIQLCHMMRKEYTLSFDKAEKSEKTIRKFLLNKADSVRFTHRSVAKIGNNIFIVIDMKTPGDKKSEIIGDKDDPVFISLLRELKRDFIRKITNDKLFNDIRHKGQLFDHYFYRMSSAMKKRLNKNSLFKAWFKDDRHYYMKII